MILLALSVVVATYVRGKAREGVRVVEITDKDKAQFQEVCRELGVRRILARLLGGIGSIFFIAGVVALFQSRADWRVPVGMIVIGLFLASCVALLVRGSR